MAVRKNRSKVQQQIQPQNSSLFNFFRPGESYTSLVLGIVVVIIAAVLILSFVRGRNIGTGSETQTDVSSDESIENVDGVETVGDDKVYKVQSGDDLWKIAEKVYKDGYRWSDIAKVNNLTNPNVIHVDNMLKLPEIDPAPKAEEEQAADAPSMEQEVKAATVKVSESEVDTAEAQKITGATYKVQKGDYLWEIAVRAYGDGFKWVEVAKANNITNPDVIFTGTELKLPR